MIFIYYSGSVRRQACDCSWLISSELEGVGVISATFVFAYAFKNLLEEDWPQQTGIYQYRFFSSSGLHTDGESMDVFHVVLMPHAAGGCSDGRHSFSHSCSRDLALLHAPMSQDSAS